MSHTPVAVNMLWCRPGKVGGSEDYLVRQLLGLAEINAPFAPTLFVLPGFAQAHPDLAQLYRLVDAPIDGANRVRRILMEHRWFVQRAKSFPLVHHGGGTMPSGGRNRAVLTIHDLQHRAYPQYVSAVKRAYLNWALPRSVKRATVVTVPTNFVRETVVLAYGLAVETVCVVPHGVEPSLGQHATDAATLRQRYRLGDGPIVVLPAMTHPHKGHSFLVRVMADHWTDPTLRLVFTGGEGAHEHVVMALIASLGQGERIIRVGRVPADDRDGLIKMAQAVVFPSEYEGFGAPIIEAMSLGTPVICSDQTCLPEVAGDAAEVLPLTLDAWADALTRVNERRAAMIAAGHGRVCEFTTATSATALVAAYERALR